MADENVDLQFLAEQGKRILAELSEARSERAEMRERDAKRDQALNEVSIGV